MTIPVCMATSATPNSTSEASRDRLPRRNVEAMPTSAKTARNGRRLLALSDIAPKIGATRRLASIAPATVKPIVASLPPMSLTTQRGKKMPVTPAKKIVLETS